MIICREDQSVVMQIAGEDARVLKVLLSPALNEGLVEIAAGYSIIPPGGHSDKTAHIEGEMFYICEGSGKILVENETEPIWPATVVWVPPLKMHQLINDSTATLKILWVLCPPGREKAIIEHADKKQGS
jgi:oxalate decarboxylase/phosphoglucose isomerase-like protein (cupin superfamily)